jgi:hypothetical protein
MAGTSVRLGTGPRLEHRRRRRRSESGENRDRQIFLFIPHTQFKNSFVLPWRRFNRKGTIPSHYLILTLFNDDISFAHVVTLNEMVCRY